MTTDKAVEFTASNVIAGGRYKGGKQNKVRVVDSIGGAVPMWVWWHWESAKRRRNQCTHIDSFIRWVKEASDDKE
jgi:hypothetical protein